MKRNTCEENFCKSPSLSFDKKNYIENLSNEIFYDIFDYLDGYQIYKAFSKLNNRFKNILNSSFSMNVQFRDDGSTNFDSKFEKFLKSNKHKIISLNTPSATIIDSAIRNSWFSSLQKINLHDISECQLVIYIFYLKNLPCLLSLSINLYESNNNLGDIYKMIFCLPYLKYLKIEVCQYEKFDFDIPISENNKLSSIEYLIINHYFNFDNIKKILLYTPKISHFICSNTMSNYIGSYDYDGMSNMGDSESDDDDDDHDDDDDDDFIELNNLINITMDFFDLNHYIFENFLTKSCPNLQILNVKTIHSFSQYLDFNEWIKLKSANLKEFSFSYTHPIVGFERDFHHSSLDPFSSTFLSAQKLILQITIDNHDFTYSIYPQKKIKDDFQEHNNITFLNNQIDYFSGVYLKIDTDPQTIEKIMIIINESIIKLIEITYLDITYDKISYDILFKFLNLFPNLQTIKLNSSYGIFLKDNDDFKKFLENNKITKLILEKPYEKYISLIIDWFPHLQSLELENILESDLESCIQSILLKIKQDIIYQQMIICIFNIETQSNVFQILQQYVDSNDFIITERSNRFYIQKK